jgi:hypothetical protein
MEDRGGGGEAQRVAGKKIKPISTVSFRLPDSPIVALAFSFDNQNLFAGTSDGDVVIFEKSNVTGLQRPPKYLNLTEM